MIGYIYEIESDDVVMVLVSEDQELIERTANDLGVDAETYALTYTPAFGCNDGLNDTDADEYDLDEGDIPDSL